VGGNKMKDYTKTLPKHIEKYIGENDLFLEIFEGESNLNEKKPPLLFVHGAYTGSWMWSKYIPQFISRGWKCYVMNMRGHYMSRVIDLTKVTFDDYLDDIREIISECSEAPIIIGFSMGGILSQKIAEEFNLAGMILVDGNVSKEVHSIVPYDYIDKLTFGKIIEPAPHREGFSSIDESEDDIAFQKKYLSMESAKAIEAMQGYRLNGGISINNNLINCPCLVINAVGSEADDKRGMATAKHLRAEYTGFLNTTHTGLLVGQRYMEIVDRIIEWLKRF
jgi:esterase/lipase